MDVNELNNLIKKIVSSANDLKNKYTDEINARVNYACIFCKNDNDYSDYVSILKENNNEILEDTYSGPLFRINALETVSGTLKLLKVRKYDENHLDLGDADFTITNYDEFKSRYINQANFKLISRQGYEMIELMDDEFNVRVYFSNPPLDEELGIE